MRDRSLLNEMRAAVRGDLERSGVKLGRTSDREPADEANEETIVSADERQAATEPEPDPSSEPEPAVAAPEPETAVVEQEPRRGILARLFRR